MVKFENLIIPSANLGPKNPMPDIKNISYIHAGYKMTDRVTKEETTYIGKGMIPTILPYQLQDGYDRTKKPRAFQAAIVENDHIRATFLPELGGRLWSLFDKDNQKELLYVNPVFQPGNLGLRNAWFSGGVEFNAGIKGHNPLTCDTLHVAVDKTADGEVLRLYEYERIRGVVYSVSAWVDDNSPTLFIRCRIENCTDETKYMYWWSTIAVPETKGTRILVPAEKSFLCFYNEDHYVLDKTAIPLCDNIDVSYPCNIPTSQSFFYNIPKESHKWIASTNEDGFGLLQCSTREMFGRKLFVWGMSQGGRHWNEWLSEEGSSYIEIQAGLANTQLEHIPMNAREVWEWTEAYTALAGDPKLLHGDYEVAVSTVNDYMLNRIGNPDTLYFPPDSSVIETKYVSKGSGWGALEEMARGERLSSTLSFPTSNDEEISIWKNLLESGEFPCPHTSDVPTSYISGRFWLEKLESLPTQTWFSKLHIGVLRYELYAYGEGSLDGAKEAFEESIAYAENPWALRNLSMLYKSEYGDMKQAHELILAAFRQEPNCLTLVKEMGMQLTSDGSDELWLKIFDTLSKELQECGRIKLLKAVALIHLERLEEATEIINENFVVPDIKDGELSVSHYWFELYRRLYAKEIGIPYDEGDANLIAVADKKYPLPKALDFRMH